MPLYEMSLMLRPRMSSEQIGGVLRKVGGGVLSKGGVVRSVLDLGQQRLAFAIRKRHSVPTREVDLAVVHFDCPTSYIPALEEEARLEDRIVRHMILKKDKM